MKDRLAITAANHFDVNLLPGSVDNLLKAHDQVDIQAVAHP